MNIYHVNYEIHFCQFYERNTNLNSKNCSDRLNHFSWNNIHHGTIHQHLDCLSSIFPNIYIINCKNKLIKSKEIIAHQNYGKWLNGLIIIQHESTFVNTFIHIFPDLHIAKYIKTFYSTVHIIRDSQPLKRHKSYDMLNKHISIILSMQGYYVDTGKSIC